MIIRPCLKTYICFSRKQQFLVDEKTFTNICNIQNLGYLKLCQDKIYCRGTKIELSGSCFLLSHPAYKVVTPDYAVSSWDFCWGKIKAEAMPLLLPQAPKALPFPHLLDILMFLLYSLLQVLWVPAGFLWVWSSCNSYGASGCAVSNP